MTLSLVLDQGVRACCDDEAEMGGGPDASTRLNAGVFCATGSGTALEDDATRDLTRAPAATGGTEVEELEANAD